MTRVGTKMHYPIFAKTKILRKFRKFSRNFRENYEIFALKFSRKFRLFHFRENIKHIFAKFSFNFAKKTRQSSDLKGTVSQDFCACFKK